MTPPEPLALLVMAGCVGLLMALGGAYQARVRLPRPPFGVWTWADIWLIGLAVVVAPLAYVAMPGRLVAAVFGVVLCTATQLAVAPLTGARLGWVIAIGLSAAAVAAAAAGQRIAVLALTDVLLALAVIGVTNLWTQTGIRAAQVSVLAGFIAVYDLVATGLSDFTARFAAEVGGLPFAPLFMVDLKPVPVGIGLGDLVMLVMYPLVATKAFGRAAGLVAAVAGLGATGVVIALFLAGWFSTGFPLLTLLGPLIIVQYAWWRRHGGHRERTVNEWRAGNTVSAAALRVASSSEDHPMAPRQS